MSLLIRPPDPVERPEPSALRGLLPAEVVDELARVEELLEQRLASRVPLAEGVARYSVGGGGKRVRPALVLLWGGALGAPAERLRDLALVAEWVHVASLLHDDVVDEAHERRGREAAYRRFGTHAAVMTGDYLLARALESLLRHGDADGSGRGLGGTVARLAEGELLESTLIGRLDVQPAEALAVADAKTAALLEWAAASGARAASAGEAAIEAARMYGRGLGRAFQLVDDALDYERHGATGKDRLSDLRAKLPTMPLLIALERSPGLVREVQPLFEGADDEAQRAAVAREVRRLGGVRETRRRARGEARHALEQLRCLPAGGHRKSLGRLAGLVVRRRS